MLHSFNSVYFLNVKDYLNSTLHIFGTVEVMQSKSCYNM